MSPISTRSIRSIRLGDSGSVTGTALTGHSVMKGVAPETGDQAFTANGTRSTNTTQTPANIRLRLGQSSST